MNQLFASHHQLLAFPHTVRLRLSLQQVTQLALLAQHGTIPRVKHLHITLEESIGKNYRWCGPDEKPSYSILCPNDLHLSQANIPHLRTFHLQQVPMINIIVLIQHFSSMAQLESLTVVNSNVKGMSNV